MISIMIGIILLPFALLATFVSIAILTMVISSLWFIAIHGWAKFKAEYVDDK